MSELGPLLVTLLGENGNMCSVQSVESDSGFLKLLRQENVTGAGDVKVSIRMNGF